jgi:hypothetical protein
VPSNLALRCRCGKLEGQVRDASRDAVNRIVCYCDDCQAFMHRLGRADLLDEHGGTDIVQVAPAAVTFQRGAEHIAAVRLGPKGLYRWYATCCKTPLGNTVSPAIPFVGIIGQTFAVAPAELDAAIGAPLCGILGKFAIGEPPPGSTKLQVGMLARVVRMLLGWKLTGKTWPHPFFERSPKAPRYPVSVLSTEERDALRGLCGPKPAAVAPRGA